MYRFGEQERILSNQKKIIKVIALVASSLSYMNAHMNVVHVIMAAQLIQQANGS